MGGGDVVAMKEKKKKKLKKLEAEKRKKETDLTMDFRMELILEKGHRKFEAKDKEKVKKQLTNLSIDSVRVCEEEEEKKEFVKKKKKKKKKNKKKKQEEEEVAYLRDATIRDLLIPERRQTKGAAWEFVLKIHEVESKTVDPKRREEVVRRDLQLYLPHFLYVHRDCCTFDADELRIFAEALQSREYSAKQLLPADFWNVFTNRRSWYLEPALDGDDYQLLCLRDPLYKHFPCLIYSYTGNSLEADLQYEDFCNMVFKELKWDDTEIEGVAKAIRIRDKYFPSMKDPAISLALADWAFYNRKQFLYLQHIELMSELWNRAVKGMENFSDVLYDLIGRRQDPFLEEEFAMIKEYIAKNLKRNECCSKVGSLIKEWFEVTKFFPGLYCNEKRSPYTLIVKEKIRKAILLGIIQKEEVEAYKTGGQILKEIDINDPKFIDCEH